MENEAMETIEMLYSMISEARRMPLAADKVIVERVAELTDRHGCKMSQIALAWQWGKGVTAPIVGATKESYLTDAVGAFDVSLTEDEAAYLEEAYVPHPIVGAISRNPPQGVVLPDAKK